MRRLTRNVLAVDHAAPADAHVLGVLDGHIALHARAGRQIERLMAGKRDLARAVQAGGEVDDARVGGIGRVFLRRVDEDVQRLVNAVDFQHIVSRAGQCEGERAAFARHGNMAGRGHDAGAEHVEIDHGGHGHRAVRFKRDEAGDFRFVQRALRAAEDLVDRHGGDARRADAEGLALGGDGVIGADGLEGHVGVKAKHG